MDRELMFYNTLYDTECDEVLSFNIYKILGKKKQIYIEINVSKDLYRENFINGRAFVEDMTNQFGIDNIEHYDVRISSSGTHLNLILNKVGVKEAASIARVECCKVLQNVDSHGSISDWSNKIKDDTLYTLYREVRKDKNLNYVKLSKTNGLYVMHTVTYDVEGTPLYVTGNASKTTEISNGIEPGYVVMELIDKFKTWNV